MFQILLKQPADGSIGHSPLAAYRWSAFDCASSAAAMGRCTKLGNAIETWMLWLKRHFFSLLYYTICCTQTTAVEQAWQRRVRRALNPRLLGCKSFVPTIAKENSPWLSDQGAWAMLTECRTVYWHTSKQRKGQKTSLQKAVKTDLLNTLRKWLGSTE